MTIESVLKELLGKHFSKVSEFSLDFIKRNHNEDGIRITFDYLQKLDLKTEKIAKNAQLLGRNPKTIQEHYNGLINLGISRYILDLSTFFHLLGYIFYKKFFMFKLIDNIMELQVYFL